MRSVPSSRRSVLSPLLALALLLPALTAGAAAVAGDTPVRGGELVFVVPDWMSFSSELDSRYNRFRESRQAHRQSRARGFRRGVT